MKLKFLNFFALFFLLVSCSNDDSNGQSDPFDTLIINTTQPIYEFTTGNLRLGGTLNQNLDNSNLDYTIGVCFNTEQNPLYNNNFNSASGFSGNTFECYSSNSLQFGVTYYFRAFVLKNETGEVIYGNQVAYSVALDLTTSIVKNISITGFSVDVNVGNDLGLNNERGICYSTNQNPTVNNSSYECPTQGSGSFNITLDGGSFSPSYYVNPNTTYYLRSYVNINGQYYYGNQVSFKTCGYTGGSGGYVFFDKGETTSGWRYLEAATSKLNDTNSTNFKWSNTSTFMSNISQEIGTGLENSILIRSSNNFTNIAATMCVFNPNNNINDWFLPSLKELKEMYKLKVAGLIFDPASGPNSYYNKNVLSSSQRDNTTCYGINFDNGNEAILSKTDQLYSGWQVRRF